MRLRLEAVGSTPERDALGEGHLPRHRFRRDFATEIPRDYVGPPLHGCQRPLARIVTRLLGAAKDRSKPAVFGHGGGA